MKMLLAFILSLSFSASAFANGPACEGTFNPPPSEPSIPANAQLTTVRLEQVHQPRLKHLLTMLADTAFTNRERDDALEKGEVRLGHRLATGESIEFKYTLDRRSGHPVFHLNSVSVSKPNGINEKVNESPLSDDGRRLMVEPIVIQREVKNQGQESEHTEIRPLSSEVRESTNEQDKQKIADSLNRAETFQVPIEIKGQLLDQFLPWLDRVPHLSRSEFRRALESNQLESVIWKSRGKSLLAEMVKIARKQTLKYMMIGGVFLGFTHLSAQYFNQPTHTTPVAQPPAIEMVIQHPGQHMIPMHGEQRSIQDIDNVVSRLRSQEHQGIRAYVGDTTMQTWQQVPSNVIPSQIARDGYLTIELQGQGKLIVISNSGTGHSIAILDQALNQDQTQAFHQMFSSAH